MVKNKKVTKAEKKTQLKRRRPYHRKQEIVDAVSVTAYNIAAKVRADTERVRSPSSIVAVHRKYLELLEAKAATLDSFLNLDWFGLVKRSREIDKLERHLQPGQRGIVSE